jgi:hypothetical protein
MVNLWLVYHSPRTSNFDEMVRFLSASMFAEGPERQMNYARRDTKKSISYDLSSVSL